jgi:hypothetical protein
MTHFLLVFLYFVFAPGYFVLIWVKYFYRIYEFNKYMLACHNLEWMTIKTQTNEWLWMESLFSSPKLNINAKATYDFIWRSNESFGDEGICLRRNNIRRVIFELPLFFAGLMFITVIFTVLGILR